MLGDQVKLVRKEADLTQTQFAERLGVKQNTIAQIEIGRREPSEQLILAICREYNVNGDWLRTGVGEMFTTSTDDALDAILDPMLLHEKETAKAVIKALAKMGGDEWKLFKKFILDTAHEIEQTEHRQE